MIGLILHSTDVASAGTSTFEGTTRVLWGYFYRRYCAWSSCSVSLPSKVFRLAIAPALGYCVIYDPTTRSGCIWMCRPPISICKLWPLSSFCFYPLTDSVFPPCTHWCPCRGTYRDVSATHVCWPYTQKPVAGWSKRPLLHSEIQEWQHCRVSYVRISIHILIFTLRWQVGKSRLCMRRCLECSCYADVLHCTLVITRAFFVMMPAPISLVLCMLWC